MRLLSMLASAAIASIALYFAVTWGSDAVYAFASPLYGLEDRVKSDIVFGLGRLFGLTSRELYRLAECLDAIKLVIAVIFLVALAERVDRLRSSEAGREMLEAGMVLVIATTVLCCVPALLARDGAMLMMFAMQAALAVAALGLGRIETGLSTPANEQDLRSAATASQRTRWFDESARDRRAASPASVANGPRRAGLLR